MTGVFVAALITGAAVLALWLDSRLPAPSDGRQIAFHAILSIVCLNLLPAAGESALSIFGVVFGLVLPALVYAFLSCIWFLRLAQRSLLGLGR